MSPPLSAPSQLRSTLTFHKGPVHCCTYNSTSSYLLSGGSDRSIKLSNPSKDGDDSLIKTYSGPHTYEVLSISVTKDNQKFVSSGGDKNSFLWDVTTGQIIRRFEGHLGKINTTTFGGNDTVLVTGSFDTTVRIWDLKSSNSRLPLQVFQDSKDSITSIVVRDHLITAASVDGYLRTWDLRMGQLFKDFFDQPITSLSLSRTSNSLILLSLLSQPSPHPTTIEAQKACHHLFDLSTGTSLQRYTSPSSSPTYKNENYRIQSSFSNSNEDSIISGDENGNIFTWDTETGKELGSNMKAHERSCLGVLVHPKKREMITWGQDGVIKIWGDQES